MFQSRIEEISEIDFEDIIMEFKESIKIGFKLINPDSTEWDLTEVYIPNWACIWNKPKNMGRSCNILVKNGEYAIVAFENQDKEDSLIRRIYRLEDLELHPKRIEQKLKSLGLPTFNN